MSNKGKVKWFTGPFNWILRFLTLKLQLLALMIPACSLTIKDTGYESARKYKAVLYTSMLKIQAKYSFPRFAHSLSQLFKGMLQRLLGTGYGVLSSFSWLFWQYPSQIGSMHCYGTCHAFGYLPEDKSTAGYKLTCFRPGHLFSTRIYHDFWEKGLIFDLISVVLTGFLWPDAGARALRHCSLCLYVKLGQMRQTQTSHIPRLGFSHTVELWSSFAYCLLSPFLSRAAIWENFNKPVDGSNICEIQSSWGGANLYSVKMTQSWYSSREV